MNIFAHYEDIVAIVKSQGPCSFEKVAEFFQLPEAKPGLDALEVVKDKANQLSELKGRLDTLVKRKSLSFEVGYYEYTQNASDDSLLQTSADVPEEASVDGSVDPDTES